MNYPQSFIDLVECFKRLPGIGSKSAERLAYHVLSMDKEYVQEFSKVLSHFQDNIHYCQKCGHICENNICEICQDETRDQSTICVVESPKDVFAMEKVKEYHGLYHVLHGTISMIDGKTIEETIEKGIEKLKAEGILEKGDIVVLAGGAKILPRQEENKVIGGCVKI